MKYCQSLLVTALFFFTFLSKQTIAQTIDIAPLNAYWKLIEPLKSGDSLSVDEWKKFLEIEPNKIYIENQGFDENYLERLRKTIQYVYMPKYDSLLQARVKEIKKDPSTFWMTYKVYVYKENEAALKRYAESITQQTYIDSIYVQAFRWLPKKLQKQDSSLIMHLLGIENDAIAGPGIIIATLWQIYNQDKLNTGILGGHEMHHALRKGFVFDNIEEKDKGIMYTLSVILNEGSADMVDKTIAIKYDDELPMGSRFKEFLLFQADSIVSEIDNEIYLLATNNKAQLKTEKDYRNLMRWSSGHCPGYYMADIIVRNGYKKELIRNIQNPFYFTYLYNKAAKKDKSAPHIFTKESIKYIKTLEKKYRSSTT